MGIRLLAGVMVVVALGGGCDGVRRAASVDPGADLGGMADSAAVTDLPRFDQPAPGADSMPRDLGAPLGVKTIWPWDGAMTVACDAEVSAWFYAAVDASSLSAKTFSVSTAKGPVAGTLKVWKEVVTFKPAARLQPMVLHTATLRPGICSTDGRTLLKEKSWTFTCDRVWGKETSIATGPKYDLYQPLAAIDGNGDGHLLWWMANGGGTGQIWRRRHDSSAGAWSTASKVHDKAYSYHLLEDGVGDIWHIWVAGNQAKSTVHARRYDSKKKAWQPIRKTTLTWMPSAWTAAAAGAHGVVLAAKAYGPAGQTGAVLFLRYSRGTGAWSKAETLASGAAGNGGVEIVADKTGYKVLIGWYMYGSTAKPSTGLQARHRGFSSTGWSKPELLVPQIGNAPTRNSRLLHMDAQGNAQVISFVRMSGVSSIMARSLDSATGSWSPGVTISGAHQPAFHWVTEMNRSTGRILVGYLQGTSKPGAWAAAYGPAKKAWTGPRKVAAKLNGIYDVTLDPEGNGLFPLQDENTKNKVHRLFARTGKWESFANLPGAMSRAISIVSGADGEALLVGLDASRATVFARWFR